MDNNPKNITEFFLKEKSRFYKKGQIILHAQDIPDGIYFIEKGFVKAYSITENGEEKIHMFYKEAEIFPLAWVFSPNQKEIFFESMENTVIKKALKLEFLSFVKSDTKHLLEIIRRIINNLEVYNDRVETLGYERTYNRLVSRLLALSKRFGRQYGKSLLIDIPVTHKDIADSTAMSRETVSREMERLAKKGVITQRGRLIVINNIIKLKKELNFSKIEE